MKRSWMAIAAAAIALGGAVPAIAGQSTGDIQRERRQRMQALELRNQYRQEVREGERDVIDAQRAVRRAQSTGNREALRIAMRDLERAREELARDKAAHAKYQRLYQEETNDWQESRRYYRNRR